MDPTTQHATFIKTFHVSPGLLVAFLIFILSCLTFIGIMNHQFIDYDDGRIILSRTETFNDFTVGNLKKIVLDDYPREEPLIVRDLSYLVNGSIFGGDNPQGYLLGNLLLHMAVCYLVFSLSLALFPERYWQAILTAVLFAVHPIHVESVAWISCRKDPLYSSLFLAALLSYSQFVKSSGSGRLFLSLVLYLLALCSKVSALSFIPLAMLYRLLFASGKRWEWREAVYFAVMVLSSFLFMRWYSGVLTDFGVFTLQNSASLLKADPGQWLLLTLEVLTFYLGKLLYPHLLSISYDFPSPPLLFADLPFLGLSLLASVALIFALLKLLRLPDKRPLFLILWFLLVLGPYLNLAGISIFVADRYLYLASFAPIVAVSYLLTSVTAAIGRQGSVQMRSLAVLAISLLVGTMASRSIKAVEVWSSTATLWENALRVSPLRLEPYIGLLRIDVDNYSQRKGTAEGEKHLAQAKAVANQGYQTFCNNAGCPPEAAGLLYQIANIYYLEDKLTKAEQFLRQGLLRTPEDIYLNYLHAYVSIKKGDIQAAQEDLEFVNRHAHPHQHASVLNDIKHNIPRLIAQKTNPDRPVRNGP